MANIATLAVKLTADGSLFNKNMSAIEGRLRKFTTSLKANLGTSLLAAGAGFLADMKETLQVIDELSKSSRQLGVSIRSLQGLRHAADLSGVSQEQLGVGLKAFSRRITEARQEGFGSGEGGSGRAGKVFERLGLTAEDLDGPIDAVFSRVADRFNTLTDDVEKMAIAQELFSRNGVQFLGIFELGSQGIAQMTDEMAKLRGVVDDVTAQNVEKINDDISRATKAWTSLTFRFVQGAGMVIGFYDRLSTTYQAEKNFAADEAARKVNRDFNAGTRTRLESMLERLPTNGFASDELLSAGTSSLLSGPIESLEANERFIMLQERAAAILEEMEGPQEQFNRRAAELAMLLDAGAISAEEFEAAYAHAFDQLPNEIEHAIDQIDRGGPQAARQGSVEAARAIAAFERQSQQAARAAETAAQKALKAEQDQLIEQKKANGHLAALVKAAEQPGDVEID